MSNVYQDGTYQALHPTWHVEDAEWKAKQIAMIIERNGLAPDSICEIGCGGGEILKQLSVRMGRHVTFSGWEISKAAYALCRQRANANLVFHYGDLLQNDDAFYDIAMAIDVVEHVESHIDFLRKLRVKARYKILHIPLDLSVYAIVRSYPMVSRRGSGHLHYFTKETALATLEDTGYRITDYMYTAGSNELKGNPGLIRALLKYPRKMGFCVHQDWTVRLLGGYALLVLAE